MKTRRILTTTMVKEGTRTRIMDIIIRIIMDIVHTMEEMDQVEMEEMGIIRVVITVEVTRCLSTVLMGVWVKEI